jgi:hypothetical protein
VGHAVTSVRASCFESFYCYISLVIIPKCSGEHYSIDFIPLLAFSLLVIYLLSAILYLTFYLFFPQGVFSSSFSLLHCFSGPVVLSFFGLLGFDVYLEIFSFRIQVFTSHLDQRYLLSRTWYVHVPLVMFRRPSVRLTFFN